MPKNRKNVFKFAPMKQKNKCLLTKLMLKLSHTLLPTRGNIEYRLIAGVSPERMIGKHA